VWDNIQLEGGAPLLGYALDLSNGFVRARSEIFVVIIFTSKKRIKFWLFESQGPHFKVAAVVLGLGSHLFVKVPRPGYSEVASGELARGNSEMASCWQRMWDLIDSGFKPHTSRSWADALLSLVLSPSLS